MRRICVQIENEKRNWQRMGDLSAQAQIPSELKGDLVNWCPWGLCAWKEDTSRDPAGGDISNPSVRSRCFPPSRRLLRPSVFKSPKDLGLWVLWEFRKKRWLWEERKFRWITWQMTKKAQESYSVPFLWWNSTFMPNEGYGAEVAENSETALNLDHDAGVSQLSGG